MFTSIKSFINSRLGKGVVIEDITNDFGYFITIDQNYLYSVLFFLKNDPDLRLNILDQIIAIPSSSFLPKKDIEPRESDLKILYQLKSLKLPYRVTVILEITSSSKTIATISHLYAGAHWLEKDIQENFLVPFEESGER